MIEERSKTLMTFYYLIITNNNGFLKKISPNQEWVDKDYFIEKSKLYLGDIEIDNLIKFIEKYDDVDFYSRGLSDLLIEHVDLFGLPESIEVRGCHVILQKAIDNFFVKILTSNYWAKYWREVNLKYLLDDGV